MRDVQRLVLTSYKEEKRESRRVYMKAYRSTPVIFHSVGY